MPNGDEMNNLTYNTIIAAIKIRVVCSILFRAECFNVLREFHLRKGPDTGAIFSVVPSSDILEHNIIYH